MSRLAAVPVLAAKALILLWQWGLSPVLGQNCRYAPSCSAYAWEALGRYGFLRGGWLTVQRVARCNPWGGAGYDPVPRTRHGRAGQELGQDGCPHGHFESGHFKHEAQGRQA